MQNRTKKPPFGPLLLAWVLLLAMPKCLAQNGPSEADAAPASAEENTLLARLDSIHAQQGAFALASAELQQELGQHYFERKLYPQAAERFRQGMHIQRINLGLYSGRQLPLAGRLADTLVADNKLEAAYKVQRYRHWLGQRHYRELPAERNIDYLQLLQQLADWQLAGFLKSQYQLDAQILTADEHYSELLQHPEIHELPAEELNQAIQGLLVAKFYAMAIEEERLHKASLQQNYFGAPMDAEQRIARLRLDIFRQGREYIARAMSKQEQKSPPWWRNQLALADWHLLFKKIETARKLYLNLREYAGDALAQELLKAQVIPALPERSEQAFQLPSKQQITLLYNLNRLGKTRNIRRAPGAEGSKLFHRARIRLQNERHR
ncbi:MAG: hypothetical protein OIF35_12585, partial [Cellvibrionaceae bacterium]|nr:hypothetical protein [Cellvibrionaceae bacterium]